MPNQIYKSHISIKEQSFNPYLLLENHHKLVINTLPDKAKIGAEAIFIGYMRDFRENTNVSQMQIVHYPQMTEHQITKIAREIITQFSLQDLYVVHRVGKIEINDAIVLISAKASHRANALQATQQMLEKLKHQVPFWKKEITETDSKWVDKNTANIIT